MTLTLSTNPQFFASAIADLGLELLLPARLEGLELLLPLLFVCFRRCGRLSLEERVGRGILANRECGTCSVLQCQCCQGDLEGQAQSRACKRIEAALIFHSTTASRARLQKIMVREKGKGCDPEEQINLKLKAPAEQCREGGSNVNYPGASADAAGHMRRVLWYSQRHQLNYLVSTVVQVWGTQRSHS
jgi:hypothetical protein